MGLMDTEAQDSVGFGGVVGDTKATESQEGKGEAYRWTWRALVALGPPVVESDENPDRTAGRVGREGRDRLRGRDA